MSQHLLSRYSPSSSKPFPLSGTSFLDLPVNVRRRVYILAGLVRFCPIDLNLEGANRRDYRNEIRRWTHCDPDIPYSIFCQYGRRRFFSDDKIGNGENFNCVCPLLPYKLLRVSHDISEEVSAILYSENSFRISRSNQQGLRPLTNLNPKALVSLRSITIRLRSSSCVTHHDCTQPPRDCGCHPLCNTHNLHDKPLSYKAHEDQIILDEWASLVDKIALHIRPSCLRLSVVCDVEDSQTALSFLKPFSRLPKLRGCAIRLGRSPDLTLQYLAQQTSNQVMGLSLDTTSSQFRGHLPEEVLIHILEYTDLIAPFDLEWRPGKGLVPYDCCKRCTDTLEVCCCSYHAAFSPKCICWRLPISIFLISQKVKELATHIFFTKNIFVILPQSGKYCDIPRKTRARGELSQFIRSLPRYAWKDLRSIQWTLPSINPDFMLPSEKGTMDWLKTVDLISRNFELSTLDISMNLSISGTLLVHGTIRDPCKDRSYNIMPDGYEAAMWKTYQRILEPMVQLKGLRNLFVYLTGPSADDLRHPFERKLESLVMSKDYDSAKRGKFRQPRLRNDGDSDEGPVFGPEGYQIWPPYWF